MILEGFTFPRVCASAAPVQLSNNNFLVASLTVAGSTWSFATDRSKTLPSSAQIPQFALSECKGGYHSKELSPEFVVSGESKQLYSVTCPYIFQHVKHQVPV